MACEGARDNDISPPLSTQIWQVYGREVLPLIFCDHSGDGFGEDRHRAGYIFASLGQESQASLCEKSYIRAFFVVECRVFGRAYS